MYKLVLILCVIIGTAQTWLLGAVMKAGYISQPLGTVFQLAALAAVIATLYELLRPRN